MPEIGRDVNKGSEMRVKLAAAITMLLAAPGVWAQNPARGPAPADTPAVVTGDANSATVMARPFGRRRAGVQTQVPLRQRLQEMQASLNGMHALLKRMQAKAASSKSKDSLAKANVDMWELMLAHLDKQFEQLSIATLAQEDLEARRAALYKQADNKAAVFCGRLFACVGRSFCLAEANRPRAAAPGARLSHGARIFVWARFPDDGVLFGGTAAHFANDNQEHGLTARALLGRSHASGL